MLTFLKVNFSEGTDLGCFDHQRIPLHNRRCSVNYPLQLRNYLYINQWLLGLRHSCHRHCDLTNLREQCYLFVVPVFHVADHKLSMSNCIHRLYADMEYLMCQIAICKLACQIYSGTLKKFNTNLALCEMIRWYICKHWSLMGLNS